MIRLNPCAVCGGRVRLAGFKQRLLRKKYMINYIKHIGSPACSAMVGLRTWTPTPPPKNRFQNARLKMIRQWNEENPPWPT